MDQLKYEQFFEIRPKTKGRPRLGRKRKAYTPADTVLYEEQLREMYDGPMFTDGMGVTIDYHSNGIFVVIKEMEYKRPKYVTGDIDNYSKSVLDGLEGAAYENDRKIVRLDQLFVP